MYRNHYTASWNYTVCKVGKTKIENVIKPLLLYFAAIFVVLLLVSYVPILSMWLPGLLGYV